MDISLLVGIMLLRPRFDTPFHFPEQHHFDLVFPNPLQTLIQSFNDSHMSVRFISIAGAK
jgi:hypothetical protein